MYFVDQAVIFIRSGNGGNGVVSFRHEKYVEFGGPDGGHGGKGGDVVIQGSSQISTLYDFQLHPHQHATHGQHGKGKQMHGAQGKNKVITLPLGTIIYDDELNQKLYEVHSKDQHVLLKGGRGGKGNTHFKSSQNRVPRFAQDGEEGITKRIRLDLKLIADVGLIGFPNAGKSTLISVVSNAKPKIADYPFTTLQPNLGVVKLPDYSTLVIADIPGIISGASQGLGLGYQFLKHIERTQSLLFLIECDDTTIDNVFNQYENLLFELKEFSHSLIKKKRLIVLTKIDALTQKPKLKKVIEAFQKKNEIAVPISAISKEGIESLLEQIVITLDLNLSPV